MQVGLVESYSDGVINRTASLNTAAARVPVRVDGVAKATLYNPNFYHAPSKLWYVLAAVLLAGAIYGLYRAYCWWQARKLKNAKQKVEQ